MITASIPIQMCQGWLYPDTFAQTYTCTEREIDPADYPGLVQAWFTAVVEDGPGEIFLVDEDGTIYADLTFAAVPSTSYYAFQLLTPIAITLNAAKKKYYVKFAADPTYTGWDLRTATIILDIDDSAKCTVQIPMLAGDVSTGGQYGDADDDNYFAFAETSQSTTYAYGDTSGTLEKRFRMFYLDKTNWATVDHWVFEVIGGAGVRSDQVNTDKTGKFALFNFDTNTMIAGSELTFTTVMPSRQTISITNADMPDHANIEWRMLIESPTGFEMVNAYTVNLYCVLTNTTAIEVHWQVGTDAKGGSGVISMYDDTSRFHYDSSKFPAGTQWYFESTGKETGGTGHTFLHTLLTSDIGFGQVVGKPGTTTAITGNTPPTSMGDWYELTPAALADSGGTLNLYSGGLAYVITETASYQATFECSNFDFDTLITDTSAVINSLTIWTVIAIMGQAATASAWGIVSGTPLTTHTASTPESGLTGDDPPLLETYDNNFSLTVDRAWVRADLLNGTFAIRIRVNQPNNTTHTEYFYDRVNVIAATGFDVAQLDFSTSARERQRTADISASLINGYRYLVHFESSVGNTTAHSNSFLIAMVTGEEAPPTPPIGTGPRRTLVYAFDMMEGRGGWFYDDYTPDVALHYGEEGDGINSILLGTVNGHLDQMTGFIDETSAIDCYLRTEARNQGDSRLNKLYGDVIVDANTQGIAVTTDVGFNNYLVSGSTNTLNNLARALIPLNVRSTTWQTAQNIGLQIQWSTSTVTPYLYLWESRWHAEGAPIFAYSWENCETAFGGEGFMYTGWLYFAHISTADITLVWTIDNVPYPIIIAHSSGELKKDFIRMPVMKAKMWKLRVSSSAPFRVHGDDCEVLVKQWGANTPWKHVRLFEEQVTLQAQL